MNKGFLIVLVIVVVVIGAIAWYFVSPKSPTEPATSPVEKVLPPTSTVTQDTPQGVLPSLAVPDPNPVQKTNPFSGTKTNPFSQ